MFARLVYRLGRFCVRSDYCGSAYVTNRGSVGGWSVKRLTLMTFVE